LIQSKPSRRRYKNVALPSRRPTGPLVPADQTGSGTVAGEPGRGTTAIGRSGRPRAALRVDRRADVTAGGRTGSPVGGRIGVLAVADREIRSRGRPRGEPGETDLLETRRAVGSGRGAAGRRGSTPPAGRAARLTPRSDSGVAGPTPTPLRFDWNTREGGGGSRSTVHTHRKLYDCVVLTIPALRTDNTNPGGVVGWHPSARPSPCPSSFRFQLKQRGVGVASRPSDSNSDSAPDLRPPCPAGRPPYPAGRQSPLGSRSHGTGRPSLPPPAVYKSDVRVSDIRQTPPPAPGRTSGQSGRVSAALSRPVLL